VIITRLSQSEDFEQKVLGKVEKWLACTERGLHVPRNMFDDYFQDIMEEAAAIFDRLKNDDVFWRELKYLLVHQVINEHFNVH
jgi:hypothetical protein